MPFSLGFFSLSESVVLITLTFPTCTFLSRFALSLCVCVAFRFVRPNLVFKKKLEKFPNYSKKSIIIAKRIKNKKCRCVIWIKYKEEIKRENLRKSLRLCHYVSRNVLNVKVNVNVNVSLSLWVLLFLYFLQISFKRIAKLSIQDLILCFHICLCL